MRIARTMPQPQPQPQPQIEPVVLDVLRVPSYEGERRTVSPGTSADS